MDAEMPFFSAYLTLNVCVIESVIMAFRHFGVWQLNAASLALALAAFFLALRGLETGGVN